MVVFRLFLSFIVLILLSAPLASAAELTVEQRRMLSAIDSGQYDQLTVEQLRQLCLQPLPQPSADAAVVGDDASAVTRRRAAERQAAKLPFAIVPHKRNYLLPVTYNRHVNAAPFEVDNDDVDRYEVKFQFSFKVPVWQNIFKDIDLWAAYTNLSFWQAYNQPFSSPFRETNHEPEIFLSMENDWELFGLKNSLILLGANHQSNGQTGSLSRSWNRLYLNLIFERGPFALSLNPWYRIPEDEKDDPGDSSGDDNPDIEKYLGYGEVRLGYKWNDQVVSLMWRNNLRFSGNKGAIQLDWTFPLSKQLRGYVQYFNGYGESLIDYNASSNRLGVGIVLTDLF